MKTPKMKRYQELKPQFTLWGLWAGDLFRVKAPQSIQIGLTKVRWPKD